ncbi:lactosylceramide 4-alpha-galactosyltransferase-like isoform X2 [Sitophilus oryzae]|uniref:Lactosylceramide 4-alpha-galactosyltransferase-like isoform X2 n=1 Tax=Sitophilus oryzae TaxID=7048 RepID=A0A6J2XL17_SITOR|nr:lactosylceramide 4-alpha-galactosyltransferase-like isoform X2 [Sitophilus oryzae]
MRATHYKSTFIKLLLASLFAFFIIRCVMFLKSITYYKHYHKFYPEENELYCHFLPVFDTLPSVKDAEIVRDTSIFFLETSCSSYHSEKILIKSRQACAVESAARMNPNRTVYLLYASPGVFQDDQSESDGLIRNLMSYSNIKLQYLNMKKFVQGTPVEKLWAEEQIYESKYLLWHISDILRILTLWKYGGIYMDLDVLVMKNLDTLSKNFAGAEEPESLANGVMGFSSNGIGHQYVNSCVYDLVEHFNGDAWAANGPHIITKFASKLCNGSVKDFFDTSCEDFHIYPIDAFYAIPYPAWQRFYDSSQLASVKEKTKNSFLIHVWNKLSADKKIPINDDVPYLDFARKYCPGTVRNLKEYF